MSDNTSVVFKVIFQHGEHLELCLSRQKSEHDTYDKALSETDCGALAGLVDDSWVIPIGIGACTQAAARE